MISADQVSREFGSVFPVSKRAASSSSRGYHYIRGLYIAKRSDAEAGVDAKSSSTLEIEMPVRMMKQLIAAILAPIRCNIGNRRQQRVRRMGMRTCLRYIISETLWRVLLFAKHETSIKVISRYHCPTSRACKISGSIFQSPFPLPLHSRQHFAQMRLQASIRNDANSQLARV